MNAGHVDFPSPADLTPEQCKEIIDLAATDPVFQAGLPAQFIQECIARGQ